jgi:hypothetical protein
MGDTKVSTILDPCRSYMEARLVCQFWNHADNLKQLQELSASVFSGSNEPCGYMPQNQTHARPRLYKRKSLELETCFKPFPFLAVKVCLEK